MKTFEEIAEYVWSEQGEWLSERDHTFKNNPPIFAIACMREYREMVVSYLAECAEKVPAIYGEGTRDYVGYCANAIKTLGDSKK